MILPEIFVLTLYRYVNAKKVRLPDLVIDCRCRQGILTTSQIHRKVRRKICDALYPPDRRCYALEQDE